MWGWWEKEKGDREGGGRGGGEGGEGVGGGRGRGRGAGKGGGGTRMDFHKRPLPGTVIVELSTHKMKVEKLKFGG
jgi:hypothetical protein